MVEMGRGLVIQSLPDHKDVKTWLDSHQKDTTCEADLLHMHFLMSYENMAQKHPDTQYYLEPHMKSSMGKGWTAFC